MHPYGSIWMVALQMKLAQGATPDTVQRIGLGGLEGRGGPHRIHGTNGMFTYMKTIKIDPR